MIIRKIAAICDMALTFIVVVFSVLMVIISAAQIVARVLNLPLSWSEEVATYLFIWWVYLGASLAIRSKSHLGIDNLVRHFPHWLNKINNMLIYLLMLIYLGFMFKFGVQLAEVSWSELTPITQIPFGVIFFVQPMCAIFMTVFILELVLKETAARGKAGKKQ
jgi:TRAP-type C4-dicarboxylate transport system permease small subunit